MTIDEFKKFSHDALHELIDLNGACSDAYKLSTWPRWDYDLEAGTLTFSSEGVPKVIAQIQVVGTTNTAARSWLWAWANQDLPSNVANRVGEVRQFGQSEAIQLLTDPQLHDTESLGWDMTAVMAKLIGAKGAYRCPNDKGFLYLVYTNIEFAAPPKAQINCGVHGPAKQTFVCEHLLSHPQQLWFSNPPEKSDPWPDAWCSKCEEVFLEQGEWNDKNESKMNIKLICHHCYELLRSQAPSPAGSSVN